jgi:hypothetical protein
MNRYEEILINPPDDFIELKSKIKNYINFYNNIKPHQSLKGLSQINPLSFQHFPLLKTSIKI